MSKDLDSARLDAIVQAVVDRLAGDWLLVGAPWWRCGSTAEG